MIEFYYVEALLFGNWSSVLGLTKNPKSSLLSGAVFLSEGSATGTAINLYIPRPRDGSYNMSAAVGVTSYSGADSVTGASVTVTVDDRCH